MTREVELTGETVAILFDPTDETVTTVDKKRDRNPIVKMGFGIALFGISIAYAELARELVEEAFEESVANPLTRLLAR